METDSMVSVTEGGALALSTIDRWADALFARVVERNSSVGRTGIALDQSRRVFQVLIDDVREWERVHAVPLSSCHSSDAVAERVTASYVTALCGVAMGGV